MGFSSKSSKRHLSVFYTVKISSNNILRSNFKRQMSDFIRYLFWLGFYKVFHITPHRDLIMFREFDEIHFILSGFIVCACCQCVLHCKTKNISLYYCILNKFDTNIAFSEELKSESNYILLILFPCN